MEMDAAAARPDPTEPGPRHRAFPADFWWGAASAGHQVEGMNVASNWWEWEQLGLVEDGTTSGRACDYWNRYPEDHRLMAELHHNGFRLGVEWARIEPVEGEFDEEAIEHYRAILADLRDRGLSVCCTLNHWVVPQWFDEAGGWPGRRSLDRWERFVRRIVPELAPYVDLWITLNEPMVPVLAGYMTDHHPPGEAHPWRAATTFRKLLLAHGIAYRLIHQLVPRRHDGGPTMVGYAAAYQHVEPYHLGGAIAPVEAFVARIVRWMSFSAWDHAVLSGRIPLPWGLPTKVRGLQNSVDFIGVNYYTRFSIRLSRGSLSNVKAGEFDVPPGIETTEMGWQVYPPGLRAVCNDVTERFHRPIYITENGCCDHGDDRRREYLLSHLSQLSLAIDDGCDIRGYMHWCFTDNFEWREGFEKRFGMIEMDHDDPDLTRRPRPSAHMLSEIFAAGALTEEILDRWSPDALDRFG